jgi:hypothetical protein
VRIKATTSKIDYFFIFLSLEICAVVSSTSHHAFVAGICTRKHCLLQFNVTFKRSKLADKM